MGKLSKKLLSILCILALTITILPMLHVESVQAEETPNVVYHVHVQNDGDQRAVKNGEPAGTTGQSKRLEGIWISLKGTPYEGHIVYSTHIQNIGWQESRMDGQMAGTTGQSLRLEAIQISLTGEIANHYDVYYRVHAQNFGWLGWAKNGEKAGTAGYAYRLESIQIQLVEKGNAAPGSTEGAFKYPKISYTTHVQNIGWQKKSYDGALAGTTGQSLRLEAIKISLPYQEYSGNVQYRTHIQNIGWEKNFKTNGQISGTSGQGLRLEAIQIQLTGEMAEHYDIYYRVHAQNFGWLGWAKNGESAGTAGYAYRLESIQVQLVAKGATAPETSDYAFISTIVGNKNTYKFHKPTCRYAKQLTNIIYFSSKEEAISNGYTPCEICKP